jgi:hypothetical protein
MLRPDGVETQPVGTEGFSSGGTLDFVEGQYLVRFISLAGVASAGESMLAAELMEERLPGVSAKPQAFSHLPQQGRLPATEKIYAGSFLGQQSLTDVYCCDYQYGGDTLTLFLTEDSSGRKLSLWRQDAEVSTSPPEGFGFVAGQAIALEDNYHGRIVAGHASGKLVGAAGFDSRSLKFVADWIESLD